MPPKDRKPTEPVPEPAPEPTQVVALEEMSPEELDALAAQAMAARDVKRRKEQSQAVLAQAQEGYYEALDAVSVRYHNARRSIAQGWDDAWAAPDPDQPWTSYPRGMSVEHGGKEWYSLASQNTAEPGTDPTKWAEAEQSPELEETPPAIPSYEQ